ncbi:MAG TPA: holo-ACP synthase [Burkholderiales bacterium]|nr:holo-ACP synthase [Burkholderiales bacterium]
MIYSIGHDIVENVRIAKIIAKYGQRFINRILSEEEYQELILRQDKVKFIAKRFAAKEAFAKACGTGLRAPILMPNIIISNNELGKPIFNFNKDIKNWLEEKKICYCHLSLSDETNLSSAFVVLEL